MKSLNYIWISRPASIVAVVYILMVEHCPWYHLFLQVNYVKYLHVSCKFIHNNLIIHLSKWRHISTTKWTRLPPLPRSPVPRLWVVRDIVIRLIIHFYISLFWFIYSHFLYQIFIIWSSINKQNENIKKHQWQHNYQIRRC